MMAEWHRLTKATSRSNLMPRRFEPSRLFFHEADMTLPPSKPPATIPIELPPDLNPVYANLARIAHAPAEFVLDFARLLPGDFKATVTARVVMSPVALKLLVHALTENLARFETTFGTINLPSGGASLADSLFRPFHPPEPPKEPPDKGEK
jgi:hypothetical protein